MFFILWHQNTAAWEWVGAKTQYSSLCPFLTVILRISNSEKQVLYVEKQPIQRANCIKLHRLHYFQVQGFKNWYKIYIAAFGQGSRRLLVKD